MAKKRNAVLQYDLRSNFDKYKVKTPLIKVALKDRVDLLSIMVSLQVAAKIIIVNIKFCVLSDRA